MAYIQDPFRHSASFSKALNADTLTSVPSSAERPELAQIKAGSMLGVFEIVKVVGTGATGKLFLARDVNLERLCALKVLHVGVGGDHREMLRREAAALAALRNDNVGLVYSFGEISGMPFFAMEFVDGRDLGALIYDHYDAHSSPVPVHRGVQILRDLCNGLGAIHKVGIVHRDLKPSNVIVEAYSGRSVIVDFGASILPKHWDGNISGTPYYMAPETFDGVVPTPSMDMYSLGCLAYELFTGRLPYVGSTVIDLMLQHRDAPVPKLSAIRPELWPFDDVVAGLLAKSPANRLQNAVVVGNILEDRLMVATSAQALLPTRLTESVGRMAAASVAAEKQGGVRVLVIDDDPMFARIAARCAQVALVDTYAEVTRESTASNALANGLKKRPDLILLDYVLPDMNGIDLLTRIRSHANGMGSEVIVVSGALSKPERWRFDILGVREFVDKPVEFTSLVDTIHKVAARRGWTHRAPAT